MDCKHHDKFARTKKKITIEDNTVSAENQVTKSESVYFLGDENASNKVLILGNSITRHGVLEEIGWSGDWGMAASSRENDYVHQLNSELGADYYMMVRQASVWETRFNEENVLEDNFSEEQEFDADIIIFMLGENCHSLVQDKASQTVFYNKLNEFIDYFLAEGKVFILTTCVWENALVDETIITIANERNLPIVDLNCVGADSSNLAVGQFEHGGVASHPGDKGMALIASLLYDKIMEL